MRDDLYMMWDEEEEIKCPHCHLMFIKEALREHIDSCHSYACTKCESSYCYGYYLKSVIISSPPTTAILKYQYVLSSISQGQTTSNMN